MKDGELKKGEIYFTFYKDNAEHTKHIFKYLSGEFDKCENICINNNNFTKSPRYFSGNYVKNTRLATLKEKYWLEACIKADKYIPYEELKFENNYEIY